ncbi:Uncharacterised protein g2696 [Pycnogonum litorale]
MNVARYVALSALLYGSGQCLQSTLYSKAPVGGIDESTILEIIDPLRMLTECGISCLRNETCQSFAVFRNRTDKSEVCLLMNRFQLCKNQIYDVDFDLIGYYEKSDKTNATIERRNVFQVSEATVLNVSDVESAWPSECWSPECPIEAVIGFRDNERLTRDVDWLICGKHTAEMILLRSGGTSKRVSSDKTSRCPLDHLLTGIHDTGQHWRHPDNYKCLMLKSPWRTDEQNCEDVGAAGAEVICPSVNGHAMYVVGFWRTGTYGIDGIKCCPVVNTPRSVNAKE